MLKKGLIILELTFVFFLTILFSKPTITKAKPVTDADVVQHFETKDHEELIISYVLEDKKELFFKTTTENAIDIQALKKELGAQKIEEITSEEIKVTLDNPDKIDFKMLLTNKKRFYTDCTRLQPQ
ncbi:hypothetical protein FHL06_04195 [Lactobacillus halodurans]|uniref:Uncharacterized protein n=1 Tax=Companilactobacillus halodurans TaxID=2584183 RepID=A0A5P0ZP27_9LACO|nr:hypothetical protein [Companilactobacillus halodurans]MQS75591.1 hypothetical protein [Companilactobacillus halodurans]